MHINGSNFAPLLQVGFVWELCFVARHEQNCEDVGNCRGPCAPPM